VWCLQKKNVIIFDQRAGMQHAVIVPGNEIGQDRVDEHLANLLRVFGKP
jgi:hypothetical protein